MFLSEVAEHVTIVTIDVPTEDPDVALRTELVDPHHQVSGAACQTHLRETKTKRVGGSKVSRLSCFEITVMQSFLVWCWIRGYFGDENLEVKGQS